MDNTKEELLEQVIEWLFDNTTEYETEHWGGAIEKGIKFYDFNHKDEMIDALRTYFNKN